MLLPSSIASARCSARVTDRSGVSGAGPPGSAATSTAGAAPPPWYRGRWGLLEPAVDSTTSCIDEVWTRQMGAGARTDAQ